MLAVSHLQLSKHNGVLHGPGDKFVLVGWLRDLQKGEGGAFASRDTVFRP
jgi:hypothetical protein